MKLECCRIRPGARIWCTWHSVIAALALAGASCASNNLIQNPGFEEGFVYSTSMAAYTAAHWTQQALLSGGYVYPESLHTGDYLPLTIYTGAEAVRAAVASGPPGHVRYYQNVPVKPDSDYSAHVWVRGVDKLGDGTGFGGSAGDSAGVLVEEYEADGATLIRSYTKAATIAATADAVKVEIDVHTSANTKVIRFILDSYISCQELYGWATYDEAELDGPSPEAVTIGQVKADPPASTCLCQKIVTAGFGGFFYIEEADRSAGIRVAGDAVAGEVVDVAGTVSAVNGEQIIQSSFVNHRGWDRTPAAVGMSCRTAHTPLASGLCATVCGKVQSAGEDSFEIVDGSGTALKVAGKARQGDFVKITGIIDRETPETPIIRPVSVAGLAPPLVVRDCTVFDSVAGTMLSGRTIVTEGERIAAIGTAQDPVQIPDGAEIIEAGGKYVIPGLIDAHTHSQVGLSRHGVTAAEIMPLYLAYGVTAIRDVGDQLAAQVIARQYANSHPDLCPRLFTCTPFFDKNPPTHVEDGVGITDPARVPAFLDNVLDCGVSTVKCYTGISNDVFLRIIQEAHLRGLPVTAHIGAIPTQNAVAAGIDCLEHIISASTDPTVMADMVARGTMIVPTLVVTRNTGLLTDLPEVNQSPDLVHVPARLLTAWAAYLAGKDWNEENRAPRLGQFSYYKAVAGTLYTAGVTILAGTDAAQPYCPPGGSLHQELELLVASGMPPAAALQAATINNARALKQESRLGSIETGKLADMVILNADPLADIKNTRTIQSVIRGGRVLTPTDLFAAVPD